MRALLTAAAVLALFAAPALTRAAAPPPADQGFVTQAGQASLAEIKAGALAARTSHTPAVAEFGRWMQADYGIADVLLKEAAPPADARVPSSPSPVQNREIRALQKLNGQQFDNRYISDELTAHRRTIALFRNEAKAGRNEKLRSFAKQSLPVLNAQFDEAQSLSAARPRVRTAGGAAGSVATATSPPIPGAGTTGATSSHSTLSQSATNPSAFPSLQALSGETGVIGTSGTGRQPGSAYGGQPSSRP